MKKIAIITGASRGVGKTVAEYLANLDYQVILIARNKKLLQQNCDNIINSGKKATYFSIDISSSMQVRSCIESIINEYGQIDLLFNNAAILKHGTTTLSDAEIEELLTINLHGAIYVAKYVAETMKKQKEGYIINVSSIGGKIAASFAGIYAASKFGLSGFSEALSKEMSVYNVKVTSICPSMIATEMTQGRSFKQDQMLQVSDITTTIGYLLSLSKNALPAEIVINCLPFIEKTTRAMYELYGLD